MSRAIDPDFAQEARRFVEALWRDDEIGRPIPAWARRPRPFVGGRLPTSSYNLYAVSQAAIKTIPSLSRTLAAQMVLREDFSPAFIGVPFG